MTKQHGYVLDTAYPAHYHKEMQPVWLAAIAALQGAAAPDVSKPYDFLELGCGRGINLIVAAATNPNGRFVGVDFNAEHVAFVRAAIKALNLSNLKVIQGDFADFAVKNTQSFDFIATHGVLSWLPTALQRSLLDIFANSLKPHGMAYVHYMSHPGATHMSSAQRLMTELASLARGDSTEKLQVGLSLLDRLDQADVFRDQPQLRQTLATIKAQPAAYVVHDFLSDYWQPQHSADVHRQASVLAGLTYLASADPFENMEHLSVPQAAQAVLATVSAPSARELIKDMARHQHQRRDLFLKAPKALSAEAHLQALLNLTWVALPNAPQTGGTVFHTPIGAIDGPTELVSPILMRLAQGPASVAELLTLPIYTDQLTLLLQSLQLLMWRGFVHPRRSDSLPSHSAALQKWLDQQGLAITASALAGSAAHRNHSPQ